LSERGIYRPIDPDRNPIIAWGTREAVDSGAEAAVFWAARPVWPAYEAFDRVRRARDGARGVYRATRAIGGRDAPPLAQVGQEWWHGAEDRTRAITQTTADFHALAGDLMTALAARRDAAAANPTPEAVAAVAADAHWLTADVQPTLEEWTKFVARESESPLTLVATDWTTFEGWQDRLKRLRELARARGFVLTSPEPAALPKTVWERGAEGAGGPAAWLGIIKVVAAAAVGIAGFAGLYAALRPRR
jgi:hypothetical protein